MPLPPDLRLSRRWFVVRRTGASFDRRVCPHANVIVEMVERHLAGGIGAEVDRAGEGCRELLDTALLPNHANPQATLGGTTTSSYLHPLRAR